MANEAALSKRKQFADLLRELFQLNQPELDFGIYRIMHARKDDINRFIERDLPRIIGEAFKDFGGQDKAALQAELEKAIKAAEAAEINPDESPRVQKIKAQMNEAVNLGREEGEVYDALITFFNRYYDEGDFISRRVYKDGTYAIPYNGEEVVLHWANKDQYYIKSSETLRDFSFRLDPGNEQNPKRVHFRVVDADPGAQNNNKESAEGKRVFVLDAAQPWEEVDGPQGKDLGLRFHYRAATPADWTAEAKKAATAAAAKKPPTQEHLRQIAVARLLGEGSDLPARWKTPLARPYIKADRTAAEYTTLQGQLDKYTKRNTFDYFIHKDLGGFLTRELDFYIKNELLRWEDVAALKNQPARLAPLLSKIEVIRKIGEKIIAFLAQLEEFQKKLWLKKKFVTEVNYCITLDRLEGHEDLLEEIFANEAQRQQWKELYGLDLKTLDNDYEKLSWAEFLAKPEYRYLVADTGCFEEAFKTRVLAEMDEIGSSIDGLLIESENLQALGLIGNSIDKKVSNIFIDPPYNTGDDGFLYKDHYQSSSWLSMVSERVERGIELLADSGCFFASIGDEEQEHLATYLRHCYSKRRFFATLVWEKKKKGSFLSGQIARMKDYILCVSKAPDAFQGLIGEIVSDAETYPCVNASNPRERRRVAPGITSKYRERDYFLKAGTEISAGNMSLLLISDLVIRDAVLAKELVVEGNWRYSQESMDEYAAKGELYITQDLYLRRIVNEPRYKRMKDWLPRLGNEGESDFRAYDIKDLGRYGWGTNEDANDELHQILGEQYAASYPKPSKLLTLLLAASRHDRGIWLDYFAGSGSTGQAVINLNREDGKDRKYILIDMGQNFDSVMKPRIQKVVYSKVWNEGKPTSPDTGVSQCFKYMRLESYEDALGNLGRIQVRSAPHG